jgi:hypothetical protein
MPINIRSKNNITKVDSTLSDKENKSASLFESTYDDKLIFRGIEAGCGLKIHVQQDPISQKSQKIVIELDKEPHHTNIPFVKKNGGQMTGNLSFSNTSNARILAGKNSIQEPTYSFLSDPDTGLVRTKNDCISLVTGGIERLSVMNDGNIVIQNEGQLILPNSDNNNWPINPKSGGIRYNKDTSCLELYTNNNNWRSVVAIEDQTLIDSVVFFSESKYIHKNTAELPIVKILQNQNDLSNNNEKGSLVWINDINTLQHELLIQHGSSIQNSTSLYKQDNKLTTKYINYDDVSNIKIVKVNHRYKVKWIHVEILQSFDDTNAAFYVGDGNTNNRFIEQGQVNLQQVSSYVFQKNYSYNHLSYNEYVACYFDFGSSSQGLLRITVACDIV